MVDRSRHWQYRRLRRAGSNNEITADPPLHLLLFSIWATLTVAHHPTQSWLKRYSSDAADPATLLERAESELEGRKTAVRNYLNRKEFIYIEALILPLSEQH